MIDQDKLDKAKEVLHGEKIISVKPMYSKTCGCCHYQEAKFITNVSKQKFGPVIIEKMKHYHCDVMGQTFVPDDKEMIKAAICEWLDKGAEMVFCTGGMSVDPDDLTPSAIKEIGGEIVTYGTPVLPGAMFLLSYYYDEAGHEIPIMGLPGCVVHAKNDSV